MLFARVLIGATVMVVLGYFVLLTSSRAEGALKTFGKYLAIWLFILPLLLIIAAGTMGRRYAGPGMMHRAGNDGPWIRQGPGFPTAPPPDAGRPPVAQAPAIGAPQPTPEAAPPAK